MRNAYIIKSRLINQKLVDSSFTLPQEVVSWMVAMQAQEYAMAKWAIGLRLKVDRKGNPVLRDDAIENSISEGSILRTHLLRPTWHFVAAEDIRWLLKLTAPHVQAQNAFMYRKMELDNPIFSRCNDILIKALVGGKHLDRASLRKALAKKKILGDGIRIALILMQSELEGIICSGPRQGNQFTYALLEERVKPSEYITREEALTMLTIRYFTSRGPASIPDFAIWSGLSVKEIRQIMASLKGVFAEESHNGNTFYFLPSTPVKWIATKKAQTSFLMPDYDEYGMSYKDRSAIIDEEMANTQFRGESPAYNRMIIINGRVAGTWKRTNQRNKVQVEIVPFVPLDKKAIEAVKKATVKFLFFSGKDKLSPLP